MNISPNKLIKKKISSQTTIKAGGDSNTYPPYLGTNISNHQTYIIITASPTSLASAYIHASLRLGCEYHPGTNCYTQQRSPFLGGEV